MSGPPFYLVHVHFPLATTAITDTDEMITPAYGKNNIRSIGAFLTPLIGDRQNTV